MRIADGCIFVAAFLPYLFTILAKWDPGYDNRRPREYLEKTEGWRRRSHWVQVNGFEVFPAFAVAVILAELRSPESLPQINLLAITFVIARLFYGVCYIADWAVLRSLIWFLGFGCVLGLFFRACF